MGDNDMMVALHDLFEKWQEQKPNKTKQQIYEEIAEMLSYVLQEQEQS